LNKGMTMHKVNLNVHRFVFPSCQHKVLIDVPVHSESSIHAVGVVIEWFSHIMATTWKN